MAGRQRLDKELVERGLCATEQEAQRVIMAGLVHDESSQLTKPGMQVRSDHMLYVKGSDTFVSRGGHKLDGALSAFKVEPKGLRALDVGCSTGGFTDCLLKRGCAHVSALDVGSAQFSWNLRNDPRVRLFERTNIKEVQRSFFEDAFDLIVCDVSFISILPLINKFHELLAPHGKLVTLIKPQFEAAREEVARGGVIRDPEIHRSVLRKVVHGFLKSPLTLHDLCVSSIKGPKGNREFFAYASQTCVPTCSLQDRRQESSGKCELSELFLTCKAHVDDPVQTCICDRYEREGWQSKIDKVVLEAWKDER